MSVKSLLLGDGARIAFQEWGKHNAVKCLGLHGWQDNSNSFTYIGPRMAEIGYHFIAIDHVGHGLSSHLNLDSSYSVSKYTSHVKQIMDVLEWKQSTIVGHSLGAGIGMLFAGAYPEMVNKLVLIDGFGPMTKEDSTAAASLRKSIDTEVKGNAAGPYKPKMYKSFKDVVNARVRIVATYPGTQFISIESARAIMERGVEVQEAEENTLPISTLPPGPPTLQLDQEGLESGGLAMDAGPVRLRNDKMLLFPSPSYYTDAQVLSFARAIETPTLLVTAEHGWPGYGSATEERAKVMKDKGLLTHVTLPGSHHLHLDPDSRVGVMETISSFLQEPATATKTPATMQASHVAPELIP